MNYTPNADFTRKSIIKSLDQYEELYRRSIADPDQFWSEIADRISGYEKWDEVSSYDFVKANIRWFAGAKVNACYNCVDRHVESGHGDHLGGQRPFGSAHLHLR